MMAITKKKKPGEGWGVPAEHAGVADNNWITRVMKSVGERMRGEILTILKK